jgi:HEPN domain-containing protein
MNSRDDAYYRLSLARGFRDTAERDLARGEWASCVKHAQLAVENSAKASIACRSPIPRTHDPADELTRIAGSATDLPPEIVSALRKIVDCCQSLGTHEHVLASYGDERARLTPWQLFTGSEATPALQQAQEAVENAERVVEHHHPSGT